MKRLPLLLSGVAASAALVAAGCGASSSQSSSQAPASSSPAAGSPTAPEVSPAGDIPDNQAFVEYAPAGAGFAVKVPEGWAQTADGAAAVFTDKLNSIRVEAVPASAAPTIASVTANELPAIQSAAGFKLGQVTSVTRPAGNGVLATYLVESAPDPVTGKTVTDAVERYSFFKNGNEVILTLSGPKSADNVDPWKTVTDSLRWTA